jgi:hypothetical protein
VKLVISFELVMCEFHEYPETGALAGTVERRKG